MKRLWNLCNKKSLQARRATTGRSRLRRLIIELLDERIPLAADAQMIKDINLLPTTFVSSPRNFTEIGNTVFFTAKTAATGEELWKTDGTTVGTVRVKDIAPGDISSISNLSQFENVNGVLYFSANDSFSGNELWRSDGTESGTYRVKDIGIGAESASPDYLTNINGSLFFSAFDTANGVELWKSDGTEAGTVRVKDIYIGSGSSSPSYLLNANGTLFFTAKDNSSGFEIWKSDGTESGTNRIKDINPGLAHSSQLARPVLLNNTVFFVATDGVRGYELWKTDGSSDGTVLVKDIETGNAQDSYPSELVNVDGALFFSANNSITGDELWKSDGTTNGTVLVKDIRSGSSGSSIAYSINYNGLLVFTATNGSNGFELWRSDGSAIGTVQIKDIFPGSGSALPSNFEILDGLLYFSANDGTNGYELWKSDGTTNGTVLVKDIRSGVNGSTPKGIANIKGSLYFSADDGASGTELWTSDGSNSGTLILKNITDGTGNSFHSMPGQYTGVNSSLFFLGYDGVHGTELWKSDGTVSGTQLVKDIRSGSSGTIAYSGTLLNNNGVLFFNATDGVNGDELWRSDGTASGTFMLKNIRSGSLGSKPFGLTNVNGTTFFVANDGSTGYELWKSDGTEAGTVRVKDIRSGTSGSSIRYMVNMSGVLYFRANDGTSGYELWRSDGTSTGTIRVKDIRAGGLHSSPSNLTNVNGVLFFTATDSTAGRELWKSDGSDTGTVRVGDIRSGSIGSYPDTFANVGGNLYFRANDGTSGYELWKSDGSSTGTLRVKDIRPGTSNSDPRSLTSFNGSLFFSANDGTNGSELWKSDGTESGTVMVKNIIDGVDGSSPTYFEISNGKLFFRAFSNPEGLQLWVSDGTNNGTQRLETLTGSSTGVFPMNLINVDNTLFYTAIDDRYGRELWRVSITDSNQPPTDIALSSTSIPENAGANAVIGTLSTTDPNPGDSFTYSLISGIGSTDNAAFNISGDKLRATNSLDFETKSSYSVRVRSTDQTGLFVEKSFLVSVSNVNEVPSDISLSSNSIAENAVVNATVGSLATTDPDVGNTFTYTLVVGAGAGDNGAFNINGSNLRASSSFNFESMSSYSVRVRSTDQGGLYTEKIFVINVSNINEEPTDINLSNATLAENSGVNAIVGSLGTVDDTQSNVIANFDNLPLLPAINSYGNLRDLNNGSSDYLGVTWDTRFQIVGRDYVEQWVNQGPNTYAKPRSASYVAFNANGENGLTLQTSKVLTGAWFARVDLGNGPYGATSITIHALNGSTVLGSVSMELTSTNPTFINTRTFLNLSGITGYRIDRTPQVSGIASRLGSWIADDFVFGDNSQSSFIYSLVPGTGSTDNSAFNISGNTLRATGSFNFEAKSSYSVRVRSTDTGGLWAEKEFIISVTDLNETPTNISLTGSYIVENAGVNILVGTLSTADPDAANTFTYNLVSGTGSIDNNKFIIDGSNLRAKQSFDFESKSSYSIRIRSTDQGGLFTEKPFVVGVTDINEAPTDIRFSTRVFTEDFSNGLNQWTNISGMVVADPLSSGRGNVLTFGQIRGGGDLVTKSVFSKGDLWNVSFDYLGTPGKGGIANDLGGYLGISPSSYWMAGTSSNWATPINLIDDNQWRRYSIDWSDTADQRLMLEDWDGSGGVPGDTLFDNILITKNTYVATTPENGVPNSFIATLGAKDPDASNTINFALVSGVGDSDNSSFTIIDGALHANNRFDFDTKSIYSVRVRATDQNGLSFEKALSIQVTNVPETITSLEIQPLMEAGRFFNRMDSATSEYMTGIYTTSSVENFSTVGHDGNTFSGSFIKSSGSATLIITDLPRHDSVDIGFLLSIIEAWDGFERGPSYSGDYFNVLVDGVPVFRESFSTFSLSEQSYVPPVGALLSYGTNLGYGPYTDSAYNMAFEPRLQQIPHTSSTLSITWESNGPGWEGVGEAWGVDNLSIKLWDSTASPANQVKSYSYSFPATATGEYDLVSTQRFSGLGSGLNTFSNDLLQSRGSATFTFMGLPEHQRIDVGFLLALFDTWDGFERGPSYSGDYFNVLVDGKPIFRESFSNFTLSEQSYVPPAGALLSFGTNLTNDPAYDSAYNMGLEPRLQQIPHTSSNLTLTFLSNGPGMDEYWGMDNLSVRLWNGSRTIDVSSAIGTNVGKLVTWDEPSASGYTYSLVTGTGDTDNSRFSITGGNLQLAQLLDPDPRNYSVRVRTTNAIGSTSDRSFIITTGVVNQAPTDIQLSKTTLQENLPTGSTVAFLEASDPQNTNNFVFQLVDGEGDLDNANFTISGNTLKTAKNLDREAKQINSIRIRATDAGGLFKDKIVDISISDSPFDIQIARDGNPINGSGNPSSMVQIGNIVYFVASHPMFGTELWRTDGTSLGTFLLKDINPGSFSSSVSNLTNVNGTLYFRANDGSLGQELWKSDGTEQGTVLVKDSRPGSLGSNPTFLFNHNGTLYFRATDGSSGYELWKSDGSTSGTVLVRDINPGTNGSFPFYFTNINGVLIFRAVNSTTGTELWKSDGTSTGTQIIKDIFSGASSSYPASLTNVNGTLFFRAADGAGGAELWKSDGTSAGTTQVKDIRPGTNGSNLSYVSNVSGTLFFRANDGTSGYELWKSDGSSVGTVRVKDIRAGISNSNPSALTNLNGTLFFTATDGSSGYELWKSNGTDAGTVRVKDIRAGVYDARPSNLTNLNGTLVFRANDGSNGDELWRTDGSDAGTKRLKEIKLGSSGSNPTQLTNIGGILYFNANDGTTGYELWRSDGLEASTYRLKDIWSGSADGTSNTSLFLNTNGILYYTSNDGLNGIELWRSDSTLSGSIQIKDIFPSSGSSSPSQLTNVNGTVFFQANDGVNNSELWKTDGTTAGTTLVKDIRTGYLGSTPGYLTNINGTLFFAATDSTNGRELWKSDGTTSGTTLVRDIRSGLSNADISNLVNINGTLFFRANDGTSGSELWKSDGTTNGTVRVKDIRPGSFGSQLSQLTNIGGILYFTANDGTNGYELWKSDGTESGTTLVKDISLGLLSSSPESLTSVNDLVYFVASNLDNGWELWKSDGTTAGTVRVKDIQVGSGSSYPRNLTNVNGTLFFRANDGTSGTELWKTDGTETGTVVVKDINTGGGNSTPSYLVNVNGVLYFSADNGINGSELWKSQGTSAGTVRVASMTSMPVGVVPTTLTNVSGLLYFTARDPSRGRELWFLDDNFVPSDISLTNWFIPEGLDPNASIGLFSSVDPDNGDLFTYTLVSGTGDSDNAAFNISGNTLRATSSFDFETKSSYTVRVRSTDQGGLWTEKAFTISVTDVNETPTDISLSTNSIAENAGANATVGTLSTTDPDAANTFTYTLVSGTGDSDNAAFNISGNSLRATSSFDFETKSSYSVRVRSTDQGGLWTEKVFTISVTDVNETPTDISLSANSIAENAGANATVGTLSTTDPDAANTFTYTLVSGTGDSDNAAFNSSGNTLRATSSFDFETKSSYTVRVRSTDQGGLWTEKAFTISVTDVNEFAVSKPVDSNSAPNTLLSTATIGTPVGITALASDLDGSNNSVTYSLDDSANNRVAIDPVSGVVTLAASILNSSDEAINITVRATSSDGSSATETFSIQIQTVIDLVGTPNADQFVVNQLGANLWSVTLNGNPLFNGTIFTSGLLRIDGLQGSDTLAIYGTAGVDSFRVREDRTSLNGLDILQLQTEQRSVWGMGAGDTFQIESSIQGVYGGDGQDRIVLADATKTVSIFDAGTGYDTVDYSLQAGPISYSIGSMSSLGVSQMISVDKIIGSQGSDSLVGQNVLTDWALTGPDQTQVNSIDYHSFENLVGGTAVDRFQLWSSTAKLSGIANGGSGSDRLTAFDQSNTWQLNGSKAGSIVNTIAFADVEALVGGTGNDQYLVQPGAVFASVSGGTGQDELNYSSYGASVSVTMATSSVTAAGLFSSIESIIGSSQTDAFNAGNGTNAWIVSGNNAGQVSGIQFSFFELLRGGSGADTFQIQAGSIPNIFGGSGTDTIVGPNTPNTWRISAAAAGTLNSSTAFREFENVTGGSDNDSIEITSSGSVTGAVSGGLGTNTLSYQNFGSTRSAEVNVTANRATGVGNLLADFQVLIGGAGNDKLLAFPNVPSVLIGNAGNDQLTGSSDRDVLIGGGGADILNGGGGQDILIGGSSSFDLNPVPLIAIRNEWLSSRTYAERIGNLRGTSTTGNPLNNGFYLRPGPTGTLAGDSGQIDSLFGQADTDWFIAESNDSVDRLSDEQLLDPLGN